MANLDFLITYWSLEQLEQMRSFQRPESITGMWYGGYVWGGFGSFSQSKYAPQREEAFQRYTPWNLLLHGCNSAWWYIAYGSGETAVAPDMSVYPIFRQTMEEVREIKAGVATGTQATATFEVRE